MDYGTYTMYSLNETDIMDGGMTAMDVTAAPVGSSIPVSTTDCQGK